MLYDLEVTELEFEPKPNSTMKGSHRHKKESDFNEETMVGIALLICC